MAQVISGLGSWDIQGWALNKNQSSLHMGGVTVLEEVMRELAKFLSLKFFKT